ncbi:MAG TPA: Clp protease N-terminal domain-containing protein [Actinomycetota bacterium]|nr:Clp protease N-terminal domain-containing protein [Actinomycetota bacterium]
MSRKLDPQAKEVMRLAYNEAERLGDDYIGWHHLLSALARFEEEGSPGLLCRLGVSAADIRSALAPDRPYMDDDEALAAIGVDAAAVRESAESEFGPNAARPVRLMRYQPLLDHALCYADADAERLGSEKVSPLHLLLSLARDLQGEQYLTEVGLERPPLIEAVLNELGVEGEDRDRYLRARRLDKERERESKDVLTRCFQQALVPAGELRERLEALLMSGGNLALAGDESMKAFLDLSNRLSVTVIDATGEDSQWPGWWISVHAGTRQAFLQGAAVHPDGRVSAVTVSDLSLLPPWLGRDHAPWLERSDS